MWVKGFHYPVKNSVFVRETNYNVILDQRGEGVKPTTCLYFSGFMKHINCVFTVMFPHNLL